MQALPEEHQGLTASLAEAALWRRANAAVYDRMATDYYRRSEGAGIEEDARLFVATLIQRFGPRPIVLDLGCGPGIDAWRLSEPGARVVGADASMGMLRAAVARDAPAELVLADLLAPPFTPGAFHGIWASALLIHVPRACLHAALSTWAGALAPGGLLHLTSPLVPTEPADPESPPGRRFDLHDEAGISAAVRQAGLRQLGSSRRRWQTRPWLHVLAERPVSPASLL